MSKEWYCIIQGVPEDAYGWEKLISKKIIANSKQEARELVELEYNRKLPMRIRSKDIKPDSLLLSLYEMKKGEYEFVHNMFIETKCKQCGKLFIPIQKFNLTGRYGNGGIEFCSLECSDKYYIENRKFDPTDWDKSFPVIYKITQISSGKVYVGQTIRSFTLRWWEHIKALDLTNKFHKELNASDITDWTFQVIEIVTNTNKLNERETYWMKYYNSVEAGFNSVISKKIT